MSKDKNKKQTVKAFGVKTKDTSTGQNIKVKAPNHKEK